jgi:DNA-binding transcriptional MocR family regulator
MALELPQLRRDTKEPMVQQILAHYRAAIRAGRLRPGDRLPPIRVVAAHAGVTRTTVQEGYRRLAEAGLVEGTVGRGTVVTGPEDQTPPSLFSQGADAAWRFLRQLQPAPPTVPVAETVASFADLFPDPSLFPVDAFRASMERMLRERGGELLVYGGHPMGDEELRRLVAGRTLPGERASAPDEILITSGAQQGLDLVLRAFTAPGDAVAVPVPSYHHLFGLLKSHGLDLVPIPSGTHGIDIAELERALAQPRVRLLYVIPTFHNPTGRTLDRAQRARLLEAIQRTRVPVLEDDSERELRFAGEALPPLRTADARGLTVTVQTLSKGLFPGVRLGWVQGAADVLGRIAALKRFCDLETSPLLQAALADFIAQGAMDRYLGELRSALRERHATAQRALAEFLPDGCVWSRPEGGFALWVETPVDGERLAASAASRGVLVTPGRIFDPLQRAGNGLRLSLSRVSPRQVRDGIRILGECVAELHARTHPAQRPLFL